MYTIQFGDSFQDEGRCRDPMIQIGLWIDQ